MIFRVGRHAASRMRKDRAESSHSALHFLGADADEPAPTRNSEHALLPLTAGVAGAPFATQMPRWTAGFPLKKG